MCDVLVLGATGFTGRLVVECLMGVDPGVRWTITARSREKLNGLVEDFGSKGLNISQISRLEVDTTIQTSLTAAITHAKIVLNCVGPNTERSEQIVQTCIQCGTHYVDMSAEVNHIFELHVKYHKAAEQANVLIIPACGFSSLIPASGFLYLQRNFQGTLDSAECYFELGIPKRAYIPLVGNCLASAGTWDSLVHVLRNMRDYQRKKADMYPAVELPGYMKRGFFHWRHRKLWFPYPGADADVIDMSERYLQENKQKRPVHFKLYCTMPLFIHYIIIPFMFLYYYLSYFNCFGKLLWKYPRFFTLGYMRQEGPPEKNRNNITYSITYIGKGWDKIGDDFSLAPNKVVKVKLSSKDPYKTTAVVIVIAALTLLKERSQMPRGGVVNVPAAFCDTTLIEKLMKQDIKYEILPKT